MSVRRPSDRHAKCNGGAEYWSKRPMAGTGISPRAGVNRKTKQFTHRIERQRNKFDREGIWQ